MEKSWIHYIKVYEDKIIEYALQYALLKRHHCMYDVQKKAFISYGISDAEDMADLQIDLIRQEANHLLTSRAVLRNISQKAHGLSRGMNCPDLI